MTLDEVWVEKYRPRSLDDVVGQPHVVSRLKGYVKAGHMPHLLFAGPPGTGKTTSALALARQLYGEHWRDNFLELNASDDRGINVVRTTIKEFARTSPLAAPFKLIFLDEADQLTADAQAALRRTMEMFAATTRFILSCNYSSKIIPPIQSRCAVFRLRPLKDEDVRGVLDRIAKEEKLKLGKDAADAILYVSEGDVRQAINLLQMAAAAAPDGKASAITEQTVYEAAMAASPGDVKEVLEVALKGDFLKARQALSTLLVDKGLSGEDVIRALHRTAHDLGLPLERLARVLEAIGEAEFRLVEGSDERVQLEALLARLAADSDGAYAKKH